MQPCWNRLPGLLCTYIFLSTEIAPVPAHPTTIHAKEALTATGWQRDVAVTIGTDGRIAGIGPASGMADTRVDLLLPAPTNLHSHAFQRAMAGLTETRGPDPRDTFWTWRQLMYRFLDRLTPDDVEAIAAQVFVEMLEAGYAAVAEFHYLHHDIGGHPYADPAELTARIVAAARDVGIGLTLLPVLYQVGGCDGRALQGGQRRFGNDPDSFLRLHDAARTLIGGGDCADHVLGVAPHSLRAVTQEGLQAALSIADTGPVHMHLAEQVAEVADVATHLGARPVEWLLGNAPVNQHWCLIHCTQMTAGETTALARSGAVVGLCPITESNLGDGIFNGVAYLGAKGRIGFGSDSNVQIALFDELRTLDYAQRLRDKSRAALATQDHSTGRVLFDHAALGGAQAAGRAAGTIATGQWADLLAIKTDNAWLCNRQGDAALDTLVFGGHGDRCISDVWTAGRHMVQGGHHPDRRRIAARFQTTVQNLGQQI